MRLKSRVGGLPVLLGLALIAGGVAWWLSGGALPGVLGGSVGGDSPGPCGPGWRIVEAADPSKEYNELQALAAVSTQDVWAVGTYATEEFAQTLIERWDGTRWFHVPSPSVSGYSNHLHAAAVVSSTDVWAIGGSHRGTSLWRTLALHWDGREWSVVPSPSPAQISILNAAAALPSGEVWAVGEYSTGSQGVGSQPLIMRWNGHDWSGAATPRAGRGGTLNGVVAISPDDVWAAGSREDASGGQPKPLVMHWDGRAWSVVEVQGAGELWAMAAVSPSDVWAVGNNGPQSLTMHWNGKSWSPVPSPNPSTGGNNLAGVAAISTRDVWAAGSQGSGDSGQTLALHWDGSRWQPAPTPNASRYLDSFLAVAAVGGNVWAAGSSITDAVGTNKTLVARYSDPCR
ncbi:MAG: hypothetical protein ACJ78Q_18295 [Chloroflexia bacterium]